MKDTRKKKKKDQPTIQNHLELRANRVMAKQRPSNQEPQLRALQSEGLQTLHLVPGASWVPAHCTSPPDPKFSGPAGPPIHWSKYFSQILIPWYYLSSFHDLLLWSPHCICLTLSHPLFLLVVLGKTIGLGNTISHCPMPVLVEKFMTTTLSDQIRSDQSLSRVCASELLCYCCCIWFYSIHSPNFQTAISNFSSLRTSNLFPSTLALGWWPP